MGFTTKFQVMVHWKNVENNKADFKTPFFLLCTIIITCICK